MQTRYKRLGKNTFLVFLGKAGSSIIGFLMLPYYTHWLNTDEYGTTDLINTYASILMGVMTCCIADAIFVFPKDEDEQGKTRYYTSGYLFAAFMVVIFVLLSVIYLHISSHFEWKGVLVERLWFVVSFAVCQFLQQYSQSFTRSIDKMRVFSISGVVYTGGIALLSFLFLPKYGLDGYLYSMLLANLLSTGYTIMASGSYRFLSFKGFDKKSLLDLLKYGVPLIPNALMWWIVNGLNRPVMESNLGLDALGIYAVANKFPILLSTAVSIFGTAWGITMLEEFGKPDFNRFFNQTIKILFFVMTIIACLIAAFSKVIIFIFADVAYFEAWRYIPVLTLAIMMQCLSGDIGGVFMAEKKSKYFFYSSIWGAITSVVATFVCIKLWGLQGAAIAVALSFFVMVIVRLFYAWKYINEMRVIWYVTMTVLYISFSVVVLMDMSLCFTIPLYLLIIGVMCLSSKDVIIPLWKSVKIKKRI